MSTSSSLIPATSLALAVDHDGPLCGIALLGPSGSGKSQTALALITGCPFGRTRLIADDITTLVAQDNYLVATAPPEIHGKIELRGTGIATVSEVEQRILHMAFRLGLSDDRQPDTPAPWAPLGEAYPTVPEYRWQPGRQGLMVFARAVLSGHSRRAGFDTIPASSGKDAAS
ncbi:MAG: hypothetical protein AAGA69_02410 [Pseudomonadota bacterium]